MMADVKSKYKQNNNNHDETTEDLEHEDAHGNAVNQGLLREVFE